MHWMRTAIYTCTVTDTGVNLILKQNSRMSDICTHENTTQKTQGCTATPLCMDVLAEQTMPSLYENTKKLHICKNRCPTAAAQTDAQLQQSRWRCVHCSAHNGTGTAEPEMDMYIGTTRDAPAESMGAPVMHHIQMYSNRSDKRFTRKQHTHVMINQASWR